MGGATHPPLPQLPISQGTEEVCRAKLLSVYDTQRDSVSFDVGEFELFFLVVTKKGSNRRAFYITAGRCTLSPPQPKGASFAPEKMILIT